MSDEGHDYLTTDARRFVTCEDDTRVEFILRSRFVEHEAASRAEDLLSRTFSQPRSARMSNLLLVGASGSGKTSVINKFNRTYSSEHNKSGALTYEVVIVQMPYHPCPREFGESVYSAMGISSYWFDRYRPIRRIISYLKSALGKSKTRMIVIEDIQSLQSGNAREKLMFVQMLRVLATELRSCLAFTGTPQARSVLQIDEQLGARTKVVELRPWKSGRDLMEFTDAFVGAMPLRRRSSLDDPRIGALLAERSGGRTDYICDAIRAAAVAAIRNGREMVDLAALDGSPGWDGVLDPFAGRGNTAKI